MSVRRCMSTAMIAAVMILSGLAVSADAAGRVYGKARFEKIKGNPAFGYQEIYEWDVFLSPSVLGYVGPARRTGTIAFNGADCYNKFPQGGGDYCINGVPAGQYSVFVNQPEFFTGHPKVVPDVFVADGQNVEVNLELPLDYSTYVQDVPGGQWTDPSSAWYQTYVAIGTSVTGVSFRIADSIGGPVDVSIHEDNGNANPGTWPQVGPSRRHPNAGALTDNWVRWRDGEVPTTPGVKYAVKCAGVGRSLQPLKRDKDAESYVGGQAYDANGNPYNFDLNYLVFAANDGTVVTMNKRNGGIGFLQGSNLGTRWGQSFTAQGQGLASADVFAAGDDGNWDLDFEWIVREGGPTGNQIGPAKRTKAAWFAPGVGLHGVSFSPTEVLLTPGQTYFVEFNLYNPPAGVDGFNPYIMTGDDTYAGGIAYQGNSARSDIDLNMTIMEYAVVQPSIELNKSAIERILLLGNSLSNDSFTITNIGAETLDYSVSDDAPWLSVSPTQGSSTGEADTITVSYNGPAIPYGSNSATITVSGNALNTPQEISVSIDVRTVGPDLDGDWDVEQNDYGLFQACYSGQGVSAVPACRDADFDEDDDVDQEDFETFQDCVTGPGIMADPACEGS